MYTFFVQSLRLLDQQILTQPIITSLNTVQSTIIILALTFCSKRINLSRSAVKFILCIQIYVSGGYIPLGH